MKKVVAISFLFVFLSANTELHQLLKLPMLLNHFLEHHDQEPDESLADFLNEHYSETHNHSDNEHHDHDNLPFKSNDCATMHSNVVFNHDHNFSFCEPHIVSEKASVATNNVVIYSSAVLNTIWQPPQFG